MFYKFTYVYLQFFICVISIKVAMWFYSNKTSSCVLSCKFSAYLQNISWRLPPIFVIWKLYFSHSCQISFAEKKNALAYTWNFGFFFKHVDRIFLTVLKHNIHLIFYWSPPRKSMRMDGKRKCNMGSQLAFDFEFSPQFSIYIYIYIWLQMFFF